MTAYRGDYGMPPCVWQCFTCRRYFVTPTRHHRPQDPGGAHRPSLDLDKYPGDRRGVCQGYPTISAQREDIIAAYLLGGETAVDEISVTEVRSLCGEEADP